MRLVASLFLCAAAAVPAFGATALPGESCRQQHRIGHLSEAMSCFASLSRSGDPLARAEGFWGLRQYDNANSEFKQAYKQSPQSAEVATEWGNLFLERFNAAEAIKLFNEAVNDNGSYAPAYLALAHAAADSYSKKAVEFARTALEHDSNLVSAHEFLAFLALEDSDPRQARAESEKALALSPTALDGMAILAAIDQLDGTMASPWFEKIARVNPVYGEAYETCAHFLVINHRYQEGIDQYRKALSLEPDLWSAHSQLGINLMRLGDQPAARKELTAAYQAHYRDPQTVNALRLLDTFGHFTTTRTATTELTLNNTEAALLRPYIEPEMQRAIAAYQRKYKMTLPGPAHLEVYPNHEDFVVRILGLPGQGGLLGVTFGLVVAMDSPSARPPGAFNWASTMWHELSHVYLLTATHNLVPRWFTEGVSVHEESAASASWGDRMTPDMIAALRDSKLLPVLQLDRGFVRPDYPGQVLVSYFEAGRMCDFIAERWGDDGILGMIHSYAARKSTADAIQANLHISPETFDKDFRAWLERQTGPVISNFDKWRTGLKSATAARDAGKWQDAISQAKAIRDFYPDYIGSGSVYQVLADAYEKLNNPSGAISELERYRDKGGSDVESLRQLATLECEKGSKEESIKTLTKLLYIYPEDEATHRLLGSLLLEQNKPVEAVREYAAALAIQPGDSAEAHYRLAKALHAAGRPGEAKDQVLSALETAPDFKPAQQLLLQLSQE